MFADEFIGGFDEMASLVGTPFIISGVSYRGIFNSSAESQTLDIGGFTPSAKGSLIVSRSVMPAAPEIGTRLTIGTEEFRIEEVNSDEVSFTFLLDSPEK